MSAKFVEFKAGAKFKPAHGLPHVWMMLAIAAATAPELLNDTLVVTEGWRKERHPNDAHTWCNAFDLRVHNIEGLSSYADREAAAWDWVRRMRAALDDPRYQFDVHGEGPSLHIHVEFDPR